MPQTALFIYYPLTKHTDNFDRCAVIPIGNLDSGTFCRRMYNLSVSYVKSHMVNPFSISVENKISRLHLCRADADSLSAWEPEDRLRLTPAPFCITYLVKPEQSTPVCGSPPPYL